MKYARTVMAYHGCDQSVAERLLAGTISFEPSKNDYDWLGSGTYFWEYGIDRAYKFVRDVQVPRGRATVPAVIGAHIQLGECFDLFDTSNTEALETAFPVWRDKMLKTGKLPENTGGPNQKMRRLDCAVMNWYLEEAEQSGKRFQTVRGGFVEGAAIYSGSCLHKETHIQLCIRDPSCILGVFRPS